MALIKPHQTPHGALPVYHRILRMDVNAVSQTVEFAVAVYVSKEARDGGAQPLWHEYPVVPFAALARDPRVAAYSILRGFGDSYLKDADQDDQEAAEAFDMPLTDEAREPTTEPVQGPQQSP